MERYIALFEYDENDRCGVVFPDFPGLTFTGDNYDDTYRIAHEGLALYLGGIGEKEQPIPRPRTLERIKREWEDWPKWEKNYKFLVVPIAVIPANQKSIRVNVMMPEGTLRLIDAVSKNRSAFLANAAERLLREKYPCRKI